MLSELGQREAALEAAQEAIQSLCPYFLQRPQAFAAWMQIMCQVYIRAAETAGLELDQNLLGPIVEVFETMSKAP